MLEQNNIKYNNEDEMDLRELFNTILKWKKFIIIFTLFVTVCSVVFALVKTPIYEAKALIEIGEYKLNNNNNNNYNKVALDDSSRLSKKLNILFVDSLKNSKNKVSEISLISVPKGQKDFIEIKALSVSNELAVKEIQKVVNYIQSEYANILEDVKKRREFEISNIETKISNIKDNEVLLLKQKISMQEKNVKDYKNQLNLIDKNFLDLQSTNPSSVVLNLMQKRDLSSMIANLNFALLDMKSEINTLETSSINNLIEQKSLLESMLLPYNYKNSKVVGNIITNNYPVKPNKKLIVVVSSVTGFILSIFLVFLLEFFKEEKKHETLR